MRAGLPNQLKGMFRILFTRRNLEGIVKYGFETVFRT